MLKVRLAISILMLFVFLPGPVWAATYYVDGTLVADCTTGNYSIANRNCTGSDGDAYNTPQEAANVVNPGDTVYFRAGTYVNLATPDATTVMTLLRSGTVGNVITLTNYNGEEVILSAAVPGDHGHFYAVVFGVPPSLTLDISGTGVRYITIDGLIIEGAYRGGLRICGPANKYGTAENPTTNIIVHNVTARNNIGINGSGMGIITIGALFDCLIEHCEFYGNTGAGVFLGRITKAWHNPESEDDMSAAHDTIVRGCLSHNNTLPSFEGNTDGMAGSNMWHCTFEDNVVYDNGDDGMDIYSSVECIVQNNIVFDHNTTTGNNAGIKFSAGGGGRHTVRGNLSFKNKGISFEGSKPGSLLLPIRPYYPSRLYSNVAYECGVGISLGYDYIQTYEGYEKTYIRNFLTTDNVSHDIFYGLATYTDSDYNFIGNAGDFSTMQGYDLDGNSVTGEPGLTEIDIDPNVTFAPGLTIEEKVAYIQGQVAAAFVPALGSIVIDRGIVVSGYHDPNTGGGGSLVAWYGAAPDIGVYEYGQETDPNNHAPVLVSITAKSVRENDELTFALDGSDEDSDPLTYSFSDTPPWGASLVGQTFTWIPTYKQAGEHTIFFAVTDGEFWDYEGVVITVLNVPQYFIGK